MRIKTALVLAFITSILAVNEAFPQQFKRYSQQLTNYQSNVDAPLTSKEHSQIVEAFGDQAQALVFDRPQRVKDLKHLLRNRIEIVEAPGGLKPCPSLSEVPLFDLYVPNLKRDSHFDPKIFNPLKYNFEFWSSSASMYKVDSTNYYIIIKAQHQ